MPAKPSLRLAYGCLGAAVAGVFFHAAHSRPDDLVSAVIVAGAMGLLTMLAEHSHRGPTPKS